MLHRTVLRFAHRINSRWKQPTCSRASWVKLRPESRSSMMDKDANIKEKLLQRATCHRSLLHAFSLIHSWLVVKFNYCYIMSAQNILCHVTMPTISFPIPSYNLSRTFCYFSFIKQIKQPCVICPISTTHVSVSAGWNSSPLHSGSHTGEFPPWTCALR